jgi:hypothetical protein
MECAFTWNPRNGLIGTWKIKVCACGRGQWETVPLSQRLSKSKAGTVGKEKRKPSQPLAGCCGDNSICENPRVFADSHKRLSAFLLVWFLFQHPARTSRVRFVGFVVRGTRDCPSLGHLVLYEPPNGGLAQLHLLGYLSNRLPQAQQSRYLFTGAWIYQPFGRPRSSQVFGKPSLVPTVPRDLCPAT